MTVGVVSTTFREADILDQWIRHILAEGVDLILVADKLADDGTRDILEGWQSNRLQWVDDTEPCHRQAYWTNRLAAEAHDRGMDWILPADVDEFPYACNGGTVTEALADSPHDKLYMHVWEHRDRDNRYADPHRMPKVAYRWRSEASVEMGSHDVTIPGGAHGVLDMRELKYRSFEHFCRKAADRNMTLAPEARAANQGVHHLRLEHMDTDQLRAEWDAATSRPTVHDPIPTHV